MMNRKPLHTCTGLHGDKLFNEALEAIDRPLDDATWDFYDYDHINFRIAIVETNELLEELLERDL
jgi:hypothetical protein